MSKNLFNTNTFQNKNVTNSNNIDTSITIDAATIDTAVIENIVNDELQGKQDALTTGDGIDITNNQISFDGTISQDITTGASNSITAGTLNYIDGGVVTSVQTEIENKQDALSTGDGIDITNNVISFDGTISQDITTGGTNSITAGTLNYIDSGVVTSVQTEIENKQDTLSAGDNISIVNNTISATDTNTTYTAATNGGLSLSGTEFSLDFDNTDGYIEIPQRTIITNNSTAQFIVRTTSENGSDAAISIRGARSNTTNRPCQLRFENYNENQNDRNFLGEISALVEDVVTNTGGLQIANYANGATRTSAAKMSSNGNWRFGSGDFQNNYKVQIDGNTQIDGTLGITGFTNVRTAIEAKQDTISESNKLEPVLIDATQGGSAVSISRAEFGCLDGVTDNIQDQIDEKQDILSATNQLFPEYVKATASGSAVSISASEFGALDGVTDNIQDQIDEKQDTLSAGDNISISVDNEISATDTTYTAGDNISISVDNQISATDTDTTYTAGDNISISVDNQISATDTTYTAGDNISISVDNQISATDTNTTYTAKANGGLNLDGTEFELDFSTINSTVTIPQRLIIEEDTTAQILVKPSSLTSNNAAISIRGARNGSTSDRTCQIRFENYDNDLSDHNDLGEIAGLVQDPATNVGGLIFSSFSDGSTRNTALTMNSNGRWHFGNSFQDSYKLQVTGASNFNGDISTTGDANVAGDINLSGSLVFDNTQESNTINRIVLYDSTYDFGFGISSNTLNYYANTTHRFQYNSTIAGGGTVGMKLENANLTVNNNLTVANDATISNDLSVTNDVTINGSVDVGTNLLVTGTDKVLGVDDTGVGFIKLKNNGTGGVIQFNNSDNKLDIQHTVNNIMSIESDKVRFYKNLIPDSSTLDIGSSSSRFQTGYFSSANLSSDLTVGGDLNLTGLLVCDNAPVNDDINRILLYDGSTGDYGFGINSNTLTYHANQNHRFIYGSTTAGGGTIGMELSSSNLTVNGNLSVGGNPGKRIAIVNLRKNEADGGSWGLGAWFDWGQNMQRIGASFCSESNGVVTLNTSGTFKISVSVQVENQSYNNRVVVGTYVSINNNTGNWRNESNSGRFGLTYIRHDDYGFGGSQSYSDYYELNSGQNIRIRTMLGEGSDQRNYDNVEDDNNLHLYGRLEIELISTADLVEQGV